MAKRYEQAQAPGMVPIAKFLADNDMATDRPCIKRTVRMLRALEQRCGVTLLFRAPTRYYCFPDAIRACMPSAKSEGVAETVLDLQRTCERQAARISELERRLAKLEQFIH